MEKTKWNLKTKRTLKRRIRVMRKAIDILDKSIGEIYLISMYQEKDFIRNLEKSHGRMTLHLKSLEDILFEQHDEVMTRIYNG